ncbi:thiamine phosphate synthase [Sphingomonas sp.]|uniref:thiamine phosphate synthase n=1 Tax=Sphingomonas sp. TaxID=28214 RepID=UPI0025E1AC1F|nr:thiamine phosphate synthase [Sphingomonas sp.]
MTDERINDMTAAIALLPRRSGIVFRHHSLEPLARRTLFDQVLKLARRSNHVLLLSGTPQQARQWGAAGAHNRSRLISQGIRTAPVHNGRECVAALHAGADLIFVSPVFATRSHPSQSPLGRVRLAIVSGPVRSRTIALGGMSATQARTLSALRLFGWAAIDAFNPC